MIKKKIALKTKEVEEPELKEPREVTIEKELEEEAEKTAGRIK
jgi:hypothetical protein